MLIIRTISELRQTIRAWKREGLSIGLAPTMGYLHEGHLTLVRAARQNNDRAIATIFVNPTQFVAGEDLERYPRDEERDFDMLRREGTDAVFLPSPAEIYPEGFSTYVEPPAPSEGWCGASRPGHFRGVCTVVSILFNLTQPDRAYFGRKDAQQLAVIRRMSTDFAFPIEIIGLPTVREPDGLAMSSRNAYLSDEQRAQALILTQALQQGVARFQSGERNAQKILEEATQSINQIEGVRLDYLGAVDENTFQSVKQIQKGHLHIGAVFLGPTRLIDNRSFE
ncbi:MAG: pantoate--beta-alanine ligase [Candidatus Hinthialibacter antarcticus]|nr:pantoate--beta-alanine ligase [Candidatus Hinthialibacter antarcticus]